jgi:hypothetical protein
MLVDFESLGLPGLYFWATFVGGSFFLGLFHLCLYADVRSREYLTTNFPWRDGSGPPQGRHVTWRAVVSGPTSILMI